MLAQALQAQGELAEAERVLRRALAIREKALGPNHPEIAAVLATLGQIALSQNRLKDAERDTSRAIAIDESALGPDNLNTALARMQLGNLRHRQLREAEALDIFSRALEVFKNAPGEADIMVPVALNNIAEVYKAQGRLQLAEERFLEAPLVFRKNDMAVIVSISRQHSTILENSAPAGAASRGRAVGSAYSGHQGKSTWGPIMPMSPPASITLRLFSRDREEFQKPKSCLFARLLSRKRRSGRITRMSRLR